MGVSGVTSTLFKRKIQDFWKDPKKAPLPHLCPAAAHAEHTAPCKQWEALRSPARLNPVLWDRAARLLEIGGRGHKPASPILEPCASTVGVQRMTFLGFQDPRIPDPQGIHPSTAPGTYELQLL